MEHLLEFCKTDAQRRAIQSVIDSGGNHAKAARAMGIKAQSLDGTVSRVKAKAALAGVAPSQDLNRPTAPGFTTKRVSTAKKVTFEDGSEGYQWHIQEPEKVALDALLAEFREGLKVELKGLHETPKAPNVTDAKLMSCYIIGDHHLGMYAWGARDWRR